MNSPSLSRLPPRFSSSLSSARFLFFDNSYWELRLEYISVELVSSSLSPTCALNNSHCFTASDGNDGHQSMPCLWEEGKRDNSQASRIYLHGTSKGLAQAAPRPNKLSA